MIYVIDLFCGAGGTTSGAHLAGAKVLACVNHDPNAIKSHKANHPEGVHFIEDIRDLCVIEKVGELVRQTREQEPGCIIVLWASLECTNFSNAKGGLPRDADSRSLADYMPQYIEAIQPDSFMVENVREFLAWGPLDQNGKPVSRTAGKDFVRWYGLIKSYGYDAEYRLLNSADFGAYQARTRLFIQFSRIGIFWPEQTHTKDVGGLFGAAYKKWNPVREVLDLDDKGKSIFTRKKPLVEATLKRIYAGLEKFATKDAFLIKNFSGSPKDKVGGIDRPSGTITCNDNKSICFLQSYYGNGSTHSPEDPAPTVTVKDRLATIFINSYYGRDNASSIDEPCPTVTTSNRHALCFLDQQYGNGGPRPVDVPAGTVTTNPKLNKVSVEFLVNPQYQSAGSSVDNPSPTVIARQDKLPLSLASVEAGECLEVLDTDSPMTAKIKRFMKAHGISDIRMRMLKIDELKQIQGFPVDYKLYGTQGEQKKFIGNAVEVTMAAALFSAFCHGVIEESQLAAA